MTETRTTELPSIHEYPWETTVARDLLAQRDALLAACRAAHDLAERVGDGAPDAGYVGKEGLRVAEQCAAALALADPGS